MYSYMKKRNLTLKTQHYLHMKYVDINLTKYVQGLYEKNYKILMNDIEEKLNKWREIIS